MTSKAKVKDWTYKTKDEAAPWHCLEYLNNGTLSATTTTV